MNMRALSQSIRRRAVDASELTMAERVALGFEIGGRCVQDLVVIFGISRYEAKRLIRLRDQLGRSWSPCAIATIAASIG